MAETRPTQPTRRVLVTGASGFVGRSVLDALSRRGVTVRAVSRRPGRGAGVPGRVVWEQADLAQAHGWDRLVSGVDAVIHLAGNPGTGREDEMMRANRDWTSMLGARAAGAGVGRFVYLSTVRVYGHQPLIDERTLPSPADPYGASKLAAEDALLAQAGGSGMAVSILRPPLVFGADRAGLFSLMAKAARYRIPLPLGGLGNRRSLIGVDNLAELVVSAALENGAAGGYRLPAAEGFDPTYGEIFSALGRISRARATTFPAPEGMMCLAARALWSKETVTRLCEDCVVDGSALAKRLNWAPAVEPEAALRSIFVA